MKVKYQELISEVEYLTSPEGFVHTCMDLQENMLFVDKELLLAAFGATLELVTITALLTASIESEEVAIETEQSIEKHLESFSKKIRVAPLPLDVQYLAESYISTTYQTLLIRYPVYTKMFNCYRHNNYQETPSIDQLLREVQLAYGQKNQQAVAHLMGIIGAKMLRGAHLRPLWLRIGHSHIQSILAGLQTAINNLKVASQFSFPVDDIQTERLKREKELENVVVDLGAVRNLRRELGGYTDKRIFISPDKCDTILERLFADEPLEDIVEDINFKKQAESILPLLEAICEAVLANVEVSQALVISSLKLQKLMDNKALPILVVQLLEAVDPWDKVFQYSLTLLKDLDEQAVPAIEQFVEHRPFSGLFIVLADVIVDGERTEKKFNLLNKMFEISNWGDGKELLCPILARFGGNEVRSILRNSLNSLDEGEKRYEKLILNSLETV